MVKTAILAPISSCARIQTLRQKLSIAMMTNWGIIASNDWLKPIINRVNQKLHVKHEATNISLSNFYVFCCNNIVFNDILFKIIMELS